MKLKDAIRFRHMRVQKLNTVQVLIRVFFLSGVSHLFLHLGGFRVYLGIDSCVP